MLLSKTFDIIKQYAEEGKPVTTDSSLVFDLGLSSLEILGILVDFEEEFHIVIPDRIIPKLHTVQDIVDYLEKNIEKPST